MVQTVEALAIDLDSMTVADYAALLVALDIPDPVAIVDILDRYTEGGLKERHWLNYTLALDAASDQVAAGYDALKKAQELVAAARAFGQGR